MCHIPAADSIVDPHQGASARTAARKGIHHARVWGLSALEDQGVAGIVMAVEQSLIMGVALVVLFMRALVESERAQQRRERFELSA